MAQRSKRIFTHSDKNEFLDDLRSCREACRKVCTKAPINGDEYIAADRLIGQIDTVAETLTGDKKYFIGK